MSKLMYKSTQQVFYSCKYHVVWCPKYRRNVLAEQQVAERLAQIIREVCQEHQAEVLSLEILPDHVHLPALWNTSAGTAHEGRSPRLLRQAFPTLKRKLPTGCPNSYLVSTVGGAPLAVIKQYLENQKHV